MKGFIRLCVGRPVTVIMALGALLLGGGFSLSVLPLDRLPEFSSPRVTVETLYPGMAAAELRSIVTIPVEDALSSVKGLQGIRSVSRDGSSVVALDFRWGTDPNGASVLVREAIDGVYPNLPEGVKKPLVVPGESAEEPHSILSVRSRTGDGVFERNMAEYELRSRLRTLDGVGRVVLVGGERPEALIRVDIPRALSGGMGPGELAQYLASEAVDVPGGNAREGDMELVVISTGRPGSVEELSRILVPMGSSPARISDLAELTEGKARRLSLFLSRGREETALEIYRRPGADPVALSRDIRRVLEEARRAFSRDLDLDLVYDSSPAILEGVKNLGVSALLGTLAVTGTLLFFIRQLRYSLLTALSIPVSAAAALAVLALTGRSLNSMSLGGIALGIGLVSDTAVIVLDLLHRGFSGSPRRPPVEGIGDRVASVSGSSFASTATTAVVFLPIMFLPGPLGALFGDLSIALIASITSGWLFAQFALPSLYRLLHAPAGPRAASPFAPERQYRVLLAAGLRRPLRLFLLAAALSLAGALILFTRPAAFVFPDAAVEAELILSFPAGTDLEAVGKYGVLLSRTLAELPGIGRIFGRAGAEEEDVGRRAAPDYRKEELRLRCVFARGAEPAEVMGEIRGMMAGAELPPGTTWAAGYPQDRTEELLGLSPARTLAIRGKDPEETGRRVREAAAKLRSAAYTLRPGGKRPELRIRPDREAAAHLGISALQMAELVQAATEGLVAARLEIEGRPLEVRLTGDLRRSSLGPEALVEAIPVGLTEGGPIFLGAVGRVERTEAEAALARLDRSDVVYLDLTGEGALMESLTGMEGISAADESVFARYRNSLRLTVLLVLLLLYMTLGAQFESFVLPGILMLTIPFSLAGAGPALLITGTGLDSGSVLALVVLFGLAVNNGIVLYETAAEKVKGGLSPAAAVYAGAAERFRPVLATTVTTLLALLPLAVFPLGASQKSMAAAMLGGMGAATALTLFALPPVFVPFLKGRGAE
ncbi:MAG: efflux RND transporter permease subunit [Spirochaetaceae bacterium]|jgi:multidrug efflux pump subunit AcrB|nr:efflux RND transporter permease subunit [Spirochaetaceae bacterium]